MSDLVLAVIVGVSLLIVMTTLTYGALVFRREADRIIQDDTDYDKLKKGMGRDD